MNIRPYNPYDRYRNRTWQRFSGFMVVCVFIGICVGIGYFFGKVRWMQENASLRQQVDSFAQEKDAFQETIVQLRTEARTATLRYEEAQKSALEGVSAGPARDLINLVTKQLEEGADPERMAYLIRSGRPPRNCTDPESRRFIVSTPVYTGADSSVSIDKDAIIVKGSGVSARNEKGDNEAWYDPAKAVSLTFVTKDGRTQTKNGIMPLSHSVVLEGREYRLTVTDSARSFAKVTFDSCDYP